VQFGLGGGNWRLLGGKCRLGSGDCGCCGGLCYLVDCDFIGSGGRLASVPSEKSRSYLRAVYHITDAWRGMAVLAVLSWLAYVVGIVWYHLLYACACWLF